MSNSQSPHWRPIPGLPGFFASADGQIWSEKTKTVKRQSVKAGHKYSTVLVWERGRDRPRKVHQLVALAFYGEPPTPGHTVDHINQDKLDNRAENLRWACVITQARNHPRCKNIYGPGHWSSWLGLPA